MTDTDTSLLTNPDTFAASQPARPGWWRRWSGPGHWCPWRAALLFLLITVVFYHLRVIVPRGADGPHIEKIISIEDQWPLYYRSFLTCFTQHAVWLITRHWGFDGHQAVALSSAMGGAFAVLALWRLCRHPLFWAVNLFAGSFLVFVGHVETYALVGAGFLWTMVLIREYLLDRVSAGLLMSVYCLSFAMHMLMLFYFPVVAWALMKGRPGRRWELLTPVVLLGVSVVIIPVFLGKPGATEVGLDRLVPLFQINAPNQYFTFFSGDHFDCLWVFACSADLFIKAPLYLLTLLNVPGWEDAFRTAIPENTALPVDRLGWPVSFILLAIFARRVQGLYLKLLLLSVGIGVGWTVIWNPDWGYMDWDLFSQFALPLHLLVGLLILPDRSAYIFEPIYTPEPASPQTGINNE